jgi:hypothetical protein
MQTLERQRLAVDGSVGARCRGHVGYLVKPAPSRSVRSTPDSRSVFVPVIILGAWTSSARERISSPAIRSALTAIAIAWVVVNVGWFAGRAIGYAQNGAGGYASERWHHSALMQENKRLDLSQHTYSNDARAVAIFADKPVAVSVAKTFFNSDSETGDLPAFVRQVECTNDTQLIWFVPNGAKYLYSFDELRWSCSSARRRAERRCHLRRPPLCGSCAPSMTCRKEVGAWKGADVAGTRSPNYGVASSATEGPPDHVSVLGHRRCAAHQRLGAQRIVEIGALR